MSQNSHIEQKTEGSTLKDRVVYFFVCMGIIAITYGFFFAIDFLPEKPATKDVESTLESVVDTKTDTDTHTDESVDPFPVTIIFDSFDREVQVFNPESDTVAVLDEALLKGVVRHPGSADFKNTGTIFLLGHSSYLPVVNNKNFQAFNGIQKMNFGDTIRLRSSDTEYVYSVDRVYQAKASNASVDIQHEVGKLTLATCNSFGTKEDRYILEATLVSTQPLPTNDGKGA